MSGNSIEHGRRMWKNSREQFESNESGCKGVARPVGRSKKRRNMETRIDGLVDAIDENRSSLDEDKKL